LLIELDLRGNIDSYFPPAAMRRFPSVPYSLAALARVRRESVSNRVSSELVFVDMIESPNFQLSIGGMNCTSHPKGCISRIRLGSTILTSDSPAKKVVMRMLLRAVLTMT